MGKRGDTQQSDDHRDHPRCVGNEHQTLDIGRRARLGDEATAEVHEATDRRCGEPSRTGCIGDQDTDSCSDQSSSGAGEHNAVSGTEVPFAIGDEGLTDDRQWANRRSLCRCRFGLRQDVNLWDGVTDVFAHCGQSLRGDGDLVVGDRGTTGDDDWRETALDRLVAHGEERGYRRQHDRAARPQQRC